jgi:ABC-type uncharacterized transport system permease subunit
MRLRTRNHHHQTTRSQLVADKLATVVFTATGMGVIAVVLGMMAFFSSTIFPLFKPIHLQPEHVQSTGPRQVGFLHDGNTPFMVDAVAVQGSCVVREINAATLAKNFQAGAKSSAGSVPVTMPPESILGERRIAWNVVDPAAQPELVDSGSSAPVSGIRCLSLGSSRFLLQDSASLGRVAIVELGIRRVFLQSSELASASPEQLRVLERDRWSIRDGRFLSKASLEAPIAELKVSLAVLATLALPDNHPAVSVLGADSEFSFARVETGATGGVSGSSSASAARQFLFLYDTSSAQGAGFLFQSKENLMTGAIVTESRYIAIQEPFRELALLAGGSSVLVVTEKGGTATSSWDELWSASQESSGVTPETQQAPLRRKFEEILKPLPIEGFDGSTGSVRGAALAFGGNTLVLVDAGGKCAGYDVSFFLLNTEGRTDGAAAPRWQSRCLPDGEIFTDLVASPAQRIALVDSQSGRIFGIDLTTGETLFSDELPPVAAQSSGRKIRFDAIGKYLSIGDGQALVLYKLHAEHLEGSLSRMFRKIHYEGYKTPSYSWQSAASTDDFEAKYSLWPLVWGTLKATLYAMIFAAPLGIFAAVYSSEILDRRTRNFIKPTIEMMASLPSVVLGYLAAIVLAPWIESNILGVILCGIIMPFSLYFFGNIVSRYSAKHVSGRGLYASRRLLFMILAGFVVALVTLLRLGRVLEGMAFGGDLKSFLAGGQGSASVLYGILFLPMVLVGLWSISLGRFSRGWRIFVFVAGPFLSFALGYVLQSTLGDSSLSVAGYSQRNALVICVAMGFAIIPIIYSLSEDALTAVPGSLRAGSLACGASVWQTTARVILPTAASGIFSALMVGFGRAIGETMIVVMATGNSPLMSINPFEGLRTLAANIAVELPEAPMGGTHYRILFFSGFLLFVLTFVMNTLAEVLRTRYRQRNKAL